MADLPTDTFFHQPTSTATTTINIPATPKENLSEFLFNAAPETIEWLAQLFYDSHVEVKDNKPELVPNSNIFQCPVCKQLKSKEANVLGTYHQCRGGGMVYMQKEDEEGKPTTIQVTTPLHPTTITLPIGWSPKVTSVGIATLFATVRGAINSNITTANFGKTSADVKQKAELQDRLLRNSFDAAYSSIATIMGYPKMYVAKELLTAKNYPKVFSGDFIALYLEQMTYNLMSAYTKGQAMTAVDKIAVNRLETRQSSNATVDYPYSGMREQPGLRTRIAKVFNVQNE